MDEDYRGNVGVVMFNHSSTEFVVKAGDRVAQLVCEKIAYPEIEVKNWVIDCFNIFKLKIVSKAQRDCKRIFKWSSI